MQDYRKKTLLALQEHASKNGISKEEIAAAYGDPNSNVDMKEGGLKEKDLTENVATVCFGGPAVQDLLQKQDFKIIKQVHGAKVIALKPIQNK